MFHVSTEGIRSPLGFTDKKFLLAWLCGHDFQLNPLPPIMRPIRANLFSGQAQTLLYARHKNPFVAEFFKDVGPNKRAQFRSNGFDDTRASIAPDARSNTLDETRI